MEQERNSGKGEWCVKRKRGGKGERDLNLVRWCQSGRRGAEGENGEGVEGENWEGVEGENGEGVEGERGKGGYGEEEGVWCCVVFQKEKNLKLTAIRHVFKHSK